MEKIRDIFNAEISNYLRTLASSNPHNKKINYIYNIYNSVFWLRNTFYEYEKDKDPSIFIYEMAIYLKPVYDFLEFPVDAEFERRLVNYKRGTVYAAIPPKLSFTAFKRQRQKQNPKRKGQGLKKGELSHAEAYEDYLADYKKKYGV